MSFQVGRVVCARPSAADLFSAVMPAQAGIQQLVDSQVSRDDYNTPALLRNQEPSLMPRILLLHGVNPSDLGTRQHEIYGAATATKLDAMTRMHATASGCDLDICYTEDEAEAIARIKSAVQEGADGIIMNPAGFISTGHALRDCIKACGLPYVETHIANIAKRGIKCVLSEVAQGVIYGFGAYGCIMGLDAMMDLIARKNSKG